MALFTHSCGYVKEINFICPQCKKEIDSSDSQKILLALALGYSQNKEEAIGIKEEINILSDKVK